MAAIQAHGLTLLGAGIVVTLTPLIIGTLFAHRVLRMNPVIICGALAGAMTVDAAVAGSCEVAQSQTPVLGVAVPYAIANVVLTVLGPIIVGLTFALIVGIVCIAGRFVGLANAAYFISDPILIGFKTGAALYIASTQLPKLFGLEGITGNFFERIGHVVVSLPEAHVPSLLFGLAAILLFVAFERALPGRPTTLVVVVAAVAAMTFFRLGEAGIKIVGDLPVGLPDIGFPRIHASDIAALIPIALACFLLAYGEAISVARSFARKHGYEIDPEQELTALGASNIATGMAHGFPVAGGMSQTAVNDMGGATSSMALIVTSAAIALTLMFFAAFFHNLPEPVLGAIVLMAASHLVRLEDLRRLRVASRAEFRISLLAFAGVLLFGLLDGLLLAAFGSLIMLIAYASRPAVVVLGREPGSGRFVNRARYPDAVTITSPTPTLRSAVVSAMVLRTSPPAPPASHPMTRLATSRISIPTKPRTRMSTSIGNWVAKISPATPRFRILPTSSNGSSSRSASCGRQCLIKSPQSKGSSCVMRRAPNIPGKSIRGASPPEIHGSSSCNSSGEMTADDPARITISPTAIGTFARAIPAKGGPKGAPGQTARMRKPAATMGSASNQTSRPTATAGTSR